VDPKEIVERGYDRIGEAYRTWSGATGSTVRGWFIAEVLARVPAGTDLLELGCGPGLDAVALARGRRYTGVDLSGRMLASARRRVPEGTFVKADLVSLDLPAASFDAVVAFYVFNHVPRELLGPLLASIHAWLVPGGWLMTAFGASDNAGWTGEWLGAETFFAGFEPEVNSRLVREAGFTIERDEVVTFSEPEGPASFQWVLAQA
jgi:SAM-dependent methyltransferase